MSNARQLAANLPREGGLSNRNLIINGAMQVAQRGTSVSGVANGYLTADRWYLRRTASGVTFDSDVTGGVLTCDNPSGATGFDLRHGIEWEDRFYGKTMTLTFTATTGSGTIHVDALVVDGSVGSTTSSLACHLHGTTTDISSYEGSGLFKSGNNYTITFDVPTDADVSFTPDMLRIAVGNTSAASQSITLSNVQLEVGDTATPFEHRSYGDELARCQRYYWNSYEYVNDVGGAASSGALFAVSGPLTTDRYFCSVQFPTEMRSTPTLTYYGGRNTVADTAARVAIYNGDTLLSYTGQPGANKKGFSGFFDTGTTGVAVRFQVIADAEL
jgi:hypothetical protein